ncbi:MaoC family dehydratase [Chloroflexota bacterium]
MTGQQRITFSQLETGHEFPTSSYQLNHSIVTMYLEAVGDTVSLYQDTNLVPPMAIAAQAMASLSKNINLPPGAIHVSQEFEFLDTVTVNDTLISHATVSRKQSRGKLHLLTVDLIVFDQKQKVVLTGKTSFILPENTGEI